MIERCSEMVYGSGAFRSYRCTKAGRLEHEGKPYCAIHHPPNVEAKRKKKHEKWDQESAQRRNIYKREALAVKLLARFTTEELESAVGVELIVQPTEPASTSR